MRLPWSLVLTLLLHNHSFALSPAKRFYITHDYYALEHESSAGPSLADVAQALGVEVVEQAGELSNIWLVRVEKASVDMTVRSEQDDRVLAKYHYLRAVADSHNALRSEESHSAQQLVRSIRYLSRQTLRQRVKRAPPPVPTDSPSRAVAQRLGIRDPLFPRQWHLVNDEFPEHMMNVTPVWDMGLTGKGVISSLVDDGLDYTSDDLAANFVSCIDHIPCLDSLFCVSGCC